MTNTRTLEPRAYYVGALNAFTTSKDEAEKMGKQFPVESLYPAAAYDALKAENENLKYRMNKAQDSAIKALEENAALKAENEAQAKRIAELEYRLSSFPIPTSVAMQKIGKLRSEGFKEYAATVLNKENQYCIVGDYGDVRWIYQRMEIVNDTTHNHI